LRKLSDEYRTSRDEVEQENYVGEKVLEWREEGTALKAQAVLFRASRAEPFESRWQRSSWE